MLGPLLIAGFSTRAAAQSARRAGFEVHAVDAFGDRDLLAAASQVEVVHDYPTGIPAACARLPPAPWMYTGGLENESEIIAAVSRGRPLLGNGPQPLVRVRDPFELDAEWVKAAETISQSSFQAYRTLVYDDPEFALFFEQCTPIHEIQELNIGSRPARRVTGSTRI